MLTYKTVAEVFKANVESETPKVELKGDLFKQYGDMEQSVTDQLDKVQAFLDKFNSYLREKGEKGLPNLGDRLNREEWEAAILLATKVLNTKTEGFGDYENPRDIESGIVGELNDDLIKTLQGVTETLDWGDADLYNKHHKAIDKAVAELAEKGIVIPVEQITALRDQGYKTALNRKTEGTFKFAKKVQDAVLGKTAGQTVREGSASVNRER